MTDLVKYEVSEVDKWGEFAKKSGVLPANCNQYQAAAIVQTGRELGLAPMQSIRSMCFVNGRLTMSVQLQLALSKNKGVKIIGLNESEDGCTVTMERDGEKITCSFTKEDAKKAGLDTKDNWKKYGKQMFRWRAIGDALRLIAPDLVMGLLDPIEAASIDAPVEAKLVEAEVVDPVAVPPPPAAVETAPPLPPAPVDEPKKNYRFLKAMKEQKERIGQMYYTVLAERGFKHSTDIVDRETQKAVYAAMKEVSDLA